MKELKEVEFVITRGRLGADNVEAFAAELKDCQLIFLETRGYQEDLEKLQNGLNAMADPQYVEQNTAHYEQLQGTDFILNLGWALRNTGKQYVLYGEVLEHDEDWDFLDEDQDLNMPLKIGDFQRILWEPENRYQIVDEGFESVSMNLSAVRYSFDSKMDDFYKAAVHDANPEAQALIPEDGKLKIGVACSIVHTSMLALIQEFCETINPTTSVTEKLINPAEIEKITASLTVSLMLQKSQDTEKQLPHKTIDYYLLYFFQAMDQTPTTVPAEDKDTVMSEIKNQGLDHPVMKDVLQVEETLRSIDEYDEKELVDIIQSRLQQMAEEQRQAEQTTEQ